MYIMMVLHFSNEHTGFFLHFSNMNQVRKMHLSNCAVSLFMGIYKIRSADFTIFHAAVRHAGHVAHNTLEWTHPQKPISQNIASRCAAFEVWLSGKARTARRMVGMSCDCALARAIVNLGPTGRSTRRNGRSPSCPRCPN